MLNWLRQLDAVLRARLLSTAQHDALTSAPPRPRKRILISLALILGAIYGLFMGWYAVRMNGADGLNQLAASTVKLPLLFLFTFAITFPSLYVFNTLLGSRLTFHDTIRVVAEWVLVILAVAASLGPILGFFTISTDSYLFIVLLNVILLGVAGVVGCASLMQRLHATAERERATRRAAEPISPPIADPPTKPLLTPIEPRPRADAGRGMLRVWVLVFAIVGLQMAWVMRPFIGAPGEPFTWFRPTDSHIFEALLRVVRGLIGA